MQRLQVYPGEYHKGAYTAGESYRQDKSELCSLSLTKVSYRADGFLLYIIRLVSVLTPDYRDSHCVDLYRRLFSFVCFSVCFVAEFITITFINKISKQADRWTLKLLFFSFFF